MRFHNNSPCNLYLGLIILINSEHNKQYLYTMVYYGCKISLVTMIFKLSLGSSLGATVVYWCILRQNTSTFQHTLTIITLSIVVSRHLPLSQVGKSSVTYRDGLHAPVLVTHQEKVVKLNLSYGKFIQSRY